MPSNTCVTCMGDALSVACGRRPRTKVSSVAPTEVLWFSSPRSCCSEQSCLRVWHSPTTIALVHQRPCCQSLCQLWSSLPLEPPTAKPAAKRSARALTQLLPSSLQACLSGPQGFAAHWLRSPFATCSIPSGACVQHWRGAKSTPRWFRAGSSPCGG